MSDRFGNIIPDKRTVFRLVESPLEFDIQNTDKKLVVLSNYEK